MLNINQFRLDIVHWKFQIKIQLIKITNYKTYWLPNFFLYCEISYQPLQDIYCFYHLRLQIISNCYLGEDIILKNFNFSQATPRQSLPLLPSITFLKSLSNSQLEFENPEPKNFLQDILSAAFKRLIWNLNSIYYHIYKIMNFHL